MEGLAQRSYACVNQQVCHTQNPQPITASTALGKYQGTCYQMPSVEVDLWLKIGATSPCLMLARTED